MGPIFWLKFTNGLGLPFAYRPYPYPARTSIVPINRAWQIIRIVNFREIYYWLWTIWFATWNWLFCPYFLLACISATLSLGVRSLLGYSFLFWHFRPNKLILHILPSDYYGTKSSWKCFYNIRTRYRVSHKKLRKFRE